MMFMLIMISDDGGVDGAEVEDDNQDICQSRGIGILGACSNTVSSS